MTHLRLVPPTPKRSLGSRLRVLPAFGALMAICFLTKAMLLGMGGKPTFEASEVPLRSMTGARTEAAAANDALLVDDPFASIRPTGPGDTAPIPPSELWPAQ